MSLSQEQEATGPAGLRDAPVSLGEEEGVGIWGWLSFWDWAESLEKKKSG